MNILIPLVVAVPLLWLGHVIYSRYIEKLFKMDDSIPTPAHALRDDMDFVPTKPFVLFGHHFASIAGGGPIIGPTLALLYGFVPVWIWIIFGAIFIGAVHDMTALFASIRERGRSMAEVAGATLGRSASLIFLSFTFIMLLMLTSVFLKLTAASLTSLVPTAAINVDPASTPVGVIIDNGIPKFVIGGIASTSVIIITLFSPLLGYLLYKRSIKVFYASVLCIIVGTISVITGFFCPIRIDSGTWMILLSIYTIFAAGIPVWLVLQPRDFTNVFLLYGGMLLLIAAIVCAGLGGETLSAPMFSVAQGDSKIGPVFPMLFITIACGAISGLHALVSGGTSAKQLSKESHVRIIGYGSMVLEAGLALLVAITVGSGVDFTYYLGTVYPSSGQSGNPILGFAIGMGGLVNKGLGMSPVLGTVLGILMVEGFVVTTLDTAVRLNRYLLEELWALIFKNVPGIMKNFIFNSIICVGAMFALAHSNTIMELWGIFGAANQLLAALTLIAVTAWLAIRKRRALVVLIPAVFMMAVTLTALVWMLFTKYIPSSNWVLFSADVVLIILALGVLSIGIRFVGRLKTATSSLRQVEKYL